jgi:hypothetical protein
MPAFITKWATCVKTGLRCLAHIVTPHGATTHVEDDEVHAVIAQAGAAGVHCGSVREVLRSPDRYYVVCGEPVCKDSACDDPEEGEAPRQVADNSHTPDTAADSPDCSSPSSMVLSGPYFHSLQLRSAYSASGSEPAFTNFTRTYQGVLDYIFATPGLRVIGTRPLATWEEASAAVGHVFTLATSWRHSLPHLQ